MCEHVWNQIYVNSIKVTEIRDSWQRKGMGIFVSTSEGGEVNCVGLSFLLKCLYLDIFQRLII